MEHRWGSREATDVAVRFLALPHTIGTGRVVNISITGAFMETALDLRVMSLVYLEPTGGRAAEGRTERIAASVVRKSSTGVGLEWCESLGMSVLYRHLGLQSSVPYTQAASRVEPYRADSSGSLPRA
jgi:hypothetical protein